MITTDSTARSSRYRIMESAISFTENYQDTNLHGNPIYDVVYVSLVSNASIMVYDANNGIDYGADLQYKRWRLNGATTGLVSPDAHNIYAKLSKTDSNPIGDIVFSTYNYTTQGVSEEKDAEGNPIKDYSDTHWMIKIGTLSALTSPSSEHPDRTLTFDPGKLGTQQDNNEKGGGWVAEMFDVVVADPKRIKPLLWFDELKVLGKSIFDSIADFYKGFRIGNGENAKEITSVATDKSVSEDSDNAIATPAYVKAFSEGRYLRRDTQDPQSVSGPVTFNKDLDIQGTLHAKERIEIGNFTEGTLGAGAAIYADDNNSTHAEVDYLKVRKKATFTDITVQELKSVGGEIILSPAAIVCSKVEELEDGYKCYFATTDPDGRTINNEFRVNDQARCQTFNLTENKYYWRLVTSVGTDHIILSKTDCDTGSDIPSAGDNITSLGNRTDADRQAAIILSAYGADAPSYKQYNGIDSYSLEGKQVTKLSPFGNELTGVVNIKEGSTGANNLEDLSDEILKTVQVGSENLLLNTSFTGDHLSEDLSADKELDPDMGLYSRSLKHWEGTAEVIDDTAAAFGKSVVIGTLTQPVELVEGDNYVVSFKAKGTSVTISLGNVSVTQPLTSSYALYSAHFVSDGVGTFTISGEATICDIKLENGTIPTNWAPNQNDTYKAFVEYQASKYISESLRNGNTNIFGGLVLSSMIKLGKYVDDSLHQVNAGISGIYNDSNDVAFWSGGTLEQAIRTVIKFKENPNYVPTESEWNDLAKFVVSHGGDVFLRGYIYALGGYFRGEIQATSGTFTGEINATGGTFKNIQSPEGYFSIDENGEINVTRGKIGGFDIDSTSIASEGLGLYLGSENKLLLKNGTNEVSIGTSVYPGSSQLTALMHLETTGEQRLQSKYGVVIDVTGGRYNYAVEAHGAIVSNRWIEGHGFSYREVGTDKIFVLFDRADQHPFRWLLKMNGYVSGNANYLSLASLPRVDLVRETLNLPTAGGNRFAVRMTIICSHVSTNTNNHIIAAGYDTTTTAAEGYPILYDNQGEAITSYALNKGDVVELMLIDDGSNNTGGYYAYIVGSKY